MSLSRNLKILFRYLYRFGLLQGLLLYIKIYFSKASLIKISLNNIQYPFYLRNHTSDIEAFNKIFVNLEYDYMLPPKANFIVDCGANVGYASIFFLSKYPNSKIICIEPEENAYKMLEQNISKYSNVICIKKAVWNSSTNLVINNEFDVEHWGKVFVVNEDLNSSGSKIEAISLNEIIEKLENKNIDILKVDIEGAELELFADNYENWLPKVKTLFIELHDSTKKGCGTSFFKAAAQYSFSYYAKGENMICINNTILD